MSTFFATVRLESAFVYVRLKTGRHYAGMGSGQTTCCCHERVSARSAINNNIQHTRSIFYKRPPENATRVSLKFFKNLPRSDSKSVS